MWPAIASIAGAIFASTGFWTLINQLISDRKKKKSAETQMLMGLGHDRICALGESYLERGWISRDEFENLHDYLYKPYEKLGGNGTAAKIMADVKRLPLKEERQ